MSTKLVTEYSAVFAFDLESAKETLFRSLGKKTHIYDEKTGKISNIYVRDEEGKRFGTFFYGFLDVKGCENVNINGKGLYRLRWYGLTKEMDKYIDEKLERRKKTRAKEEMRRERKIKDEIGENLDMISEYAVKGGSMRVTDINMTEYKEPLQKLVELYGKLGKKITPSRILNRHFKEERRKVKEETSIRKSGLEEKGFEYYRKKLREEWRGERKTTFILADKKHGSCLRRLKYHDTKKRTCSQLLKEDVWPDDENLIVNRGMRIKKKGKKRRHFRRRRNV